MPEPELSLILGGARSGKSRRAESLIGAYSSPWTYIATAQVFDEEMRERVSEHQARRDARWETVEAPLDLLGVLAAQPAGRPVLVDCLTLWLTNVMLAERDIAAERASLVDVFSKPTGPWIVVSNEVGQGIVPDNALARRFRDEAGRLNQAVAACADTVELIVAGIPLKVK